MVAILLRAAPWILGVSAIAAAALWFHNGGVQSAVSKNNARTLERVQQILEARGEQRARDWQRMEQYLAETAARHDKLIDLLGQIDELQSPDCNSLSSDWVRLYNDSNH